MTHKEIAQTTVAVLSILTAAYSFFQKEEVAEDLQFSQKQFIAVVSAMHKECKP